MDVEGRSAHGGTPQKGVSAIEELVTQIGRFKRLRTGETTVNVGLIGGGEKANVVAENAWAVLDVRFWKAADRDRVLRILREAVPNLRGARIKVTVESTTPPMEKTKASDKLFARAQEIAAGLGLTAQGRQDGRRFGRVDRGGPGHPDPRRPRPGRGRHPRRDTNISSFRPSSNGRRC